MELTTIQIIISVVIGGITGMAYGLWNYFTKTDPGEFETKRFVSSAVFGVLIGFAASYVVFQSGVSYENAEWWMIIGGLFLAYSGMQVYVNRFIDWIWVNYYGKKFGGPMMFSPSFEPGFTVKPAFVDVVSGTPVALSILVSPDSGIHKVVNVTVDWMDGTDPQVYHPVKGEVYIAHTYTYKQGNTQYTGHTFYPLFVIRTVDGISKVFNTQTTGRCCAIGVSDPEANL